MSGPGATPAVMASSGRRPDVDLSAQPARCSSGPAIGLPEAARLLSMLPLIAIITILLYGCAPIEQRPPEQRTQVVEVKVPVPVPCFTEAERPILPPPTPIDIDHATTDQLAAALAADDANEALFAKLVDALFVQCLKSTGGTK